MPGTKNKIEFGDFQTADALATKVVKVLRSLGIDPRTVIEPTCGTGAFLVAALRGFDSLHKIVGLEINRHYFNIANDRIGREITGASVDLRCGDFFQMNWDALLNDLSPPVLILGNPPWVTASGLSAIGGSNLPVKSNFQNRSGLDALTGKSNFDIAEWILLRLMSAGVGPDTTIAMLVKTSVARRTLLHAWRSQFPIASSRLYTFDASVHFGVAADACLLVCQIGLTSCEPVADLFSLDQPSELSGRIGYRDGILVAEVSAYESTRHLIREERPHAPYRWRSGIKHDCAAVMELRRRPSGEYVSGAGDLVDIEDQFLFPLLKGSDVATKRIESIDRYLIVPQRATGEDTSRVRVRAPRTWEYLLSHRARFEARKSSIYRNRPPFSVFGVGPYTFAPWKVAICGLYKRLSFALVGPYDDRPVVFDDTVYSIGCHTSDEASMLLQMLTSEIASRFFQAHVFWDSKRPITAEVLNRLDLARLAEELGVQETLLDINAASAAAVGLFGGSRDEQ